ncbi:sugar ABC transporter ATP-binding protein [Mesoaciditoga lauensis]|uniref:sugar ABC transporter ATP-binding protein n=1 Tax=Mesoaciditoga lauensis TaxID=1495039 RepID=UPI00056762D6|nr:sugar ABC transporter ATP-binding protein [Mesoaciditoga lauensis]
MFDDYELYAEKISKSFGATKALNSVSLGVKRGEIHAIVGENGAGKSTFIKILSGIERMDTGSIYIEGSKTEIRNPIEAYGKGISTVFQEPLVFPDLTVAENLFIGNRKLTRFKSIRRGEEINLSKEILQKVNLPPSYSRVKIKNLSLANQQRVLIAKALLHDAKILILDEPTSILSRAETDMLFGMIHSLSEKGVSVIYISHRMEEIFEIADVVSVFRNGHLIDTSPVNEVSYDDLVRKIAGAEESDKWKISTFKVAESEQRSKKHEIILKVEKLSGKGFDNVSFTLRKGEILGFFGLVGAGRTEVMEAIVGIRKSKAGTIMLEGKEIKPKGVHNSIKEGIIYLPEDRQSEGLYLSKEKSILFNAISPVFERYSFFGFQNKNKAIIDVNKLFNRLKVKAPSIKTYVDSLSGGNQQKVMFLKYLNCTPKIFIIDEPTRGVDVMTKEEIYELLKNLKNDVPIIMVSSDLEELLLIADRLIVMHEGEISQKFERINFNKENIMKAAFGLIKEKEESIG